MSLEQRTKDIWPANKYARYIWLMRGLWDDMAALIKAGKKIDDPHTKYVVIKHLLVDLDSMDELIKEFQDYVFKKEIKNLSEFNKTEIQKLFTSYHKNLEPKRKILKEIRNNLGAHRSGIPRQKRKSSKIAEKDAWGKYEQHVIELEKECKLKNWMKQLNTIVELINCLQNFNLDSWFSVTKKGQFHLYIPINLA